MERTKKETEKVTEKIIVKKIRYRKIGGGTFRLKSGRIIKPNQSFEAFPEEIPAAFKDLLVILSSPEEVEAIRAAEARELKKLTVSEGIYKVVGSKAKGYNVIKIGEENKFLNEKPFTGEDAKKHADELVTALES